MALPCLIYAMTDSATNPSGNAVKLIRSSNADPSFLRNAREAARYGAMESDAERVGRAVKSALDTEVGGDGRFLIDYSGAAQFLANLSEGFAAEIIKTASFVGHRRNMAPRLVRAATGDLYYRQHQAYSEILIEFAKDGRMTIVSVDGAPFSCDEAHGWEPDTDWEPSQAATELEWQGEIPAYFRDAIRSHWDDKNLVAALESLFWNQFSPSLENPFVKDDREDMRFWVQPNDLATISHGRGMIVDHERKEPFLDIAANLIRAMAPEPTDGERDCLVFEMAWEKKTAKTTRRRPARFLEQSFETSPQITKLFGDLIRWLAPAGSRYRNLMGVRASSGTLGPLRIVLEAPAVPLSAHEKMEAAGEAARGLTAIGFDPAKYGL